MQTAPIRIFNSEKKWTFRVSGGNSSLVTDHFKLSDACAEAMRRGASFADLDGILETFKKEA